MSEWKSQEQHIEGLVKEMFGRRENRCQASCSWLHLVLAKGSITTQSRSVQKVFLGSTLVPMSPI